MRGEPDLPRSRALDVVVLVGVMLRLPVLWLGVKILEAEYVHALALGGGGGFSDQVGSVRIGSVPQKFLGGAPVHFPKVPGLLVVSHQRIFGRKVVLGRIADVNTVFSF